MTGAYDFLKKLIDNCDLVFEGHIISKELLIKNYADFLAGNFEKKHNVTISLHTGSICFDIITVLVSVFSNIIYDRLTIDDFVNSLSPGDLLLYGKERCRFEGIAEPFVNPQGKIIKRIIIATADKGITTGNKTTLVESKWNQLTPYYGKSKRLDGRGVRNDNKKRTDFLSSVFGMQPDEIPAFVEKSSVVVMNKTVAERIINNLQIYYNLNSIKITEIMPVSYCSETAEYPFGGNPGKIEPAIKITNSISTARDLVTGTWQGGQNWINDVVGVSIIGFDMISRAKTEVLEMMKRRKLKYVFLSYNISSIDGETFLDEVEDSSIFACTTEYLLSSSLPTVEKNPITEELEKQVDSVIEHKTISLPVKTFDCGWEDYRKVQLALRLLRHSGYKEAEDFVPLAYSVLNLIITSVFPLETMENMVETEMLAVESPINRITRLTEISSSFTGEARTVAKTIIDFLEEGYTKLITVSPKEEELNSLLKEYRNQNVAIIVPKAYYANILYRRGILEYFDEKENLCISTANSFNYSNQYDVIIAIGAFWGKKFDPFRCRSSSKIYVIVSAIEENIFRYRKNKSVVIERKINIKAKIPFEEQDINETEYSDGATEEEVCEVITSADDVGEYISRFFETNALRILNSNAGSRCGTTDISYVATCESGERIFFTKKYSAYVFDTANEDVMEVSVEKLSSGDTVIFKSNSDETRDIVTMLLDKYIDEYQTAGEEVQMAYLKSRYWKEVLRDYKRNNGLSLKDLAKQLERNGSKKHWVTIQSWISEDSYIVGPQDSETYFAIAQMTNDAELLSDPDSFRKACDRIRSVRVGILKLIAKTIISKYSGKLSVDNDLAKVVSENIDDISILVQIETIIPVEEQKAPVNMVNRPLCLS